MFRTILMVIFLSKTSHSANILGIFHVPSKSHYILGSALFEGLAKHGHNVTMVSPYPYRNTISTYQNVVLEEIHQFKEDRMQRLINPNHTNLMINPISIIEIFADLSDLVLSSKQLKELKSQKFDLIILYSLFTESLLGLAHHFKAPVILFSTFGSMPNIDKLTGNVSPPSYLATLSFNKPGEMTFWQRMSNFWSVLLAYLVFLPLNDYYQKQVLKKHFPSAPLLKELEETVAMVFLNTHYSLEIPRPYITNVIPIGGIHIKKARLLPQDLQQFLDNSPNGVVYFSLGSNTEMASLPHNKIQAIINVLGNLKMRVIFKSETFFDNLPVNIKIQRWLPQNDLLAHQNVKLFITHGGALSLIESIYHGVPFLGVPIFGDQHYNIQNAISNNFTIRVDFDSLTEASFKAGIQKVLTDPVIARNIRLRSSLIRNQDLDPLEKAVFWVNHVLKHKGADHLKSFSRKMPYVQYFLIDVVLFNLTALAIAVLIIIYLVKKLLNSSLIFKKTKNKND